MALLRRRLKLDVLKPSTDWCWPDGPREVRLPGASLDALARALAVGGSGALLVYRGRGFVLRWEDAPPAVGAAVPAGVGAAGLAVGAPQGIDLAAPAPDLGAAYATAVAPTSGDDDGVVAIRRYNLTSRHRSRAIRQTGDDLDAPGPFVELVALPRDGRGADGADPDGAGLRDAIWWLLSRTGAALDEIG